jgi:hypothetical protein
MTTTEPILDASDDLALINSEGSIIDYVAWGADAGSGDKDSTDTNAVADWENSGTSKADPYGVNATAVTQGSQNYDFVIPEYSSFMLPMATIILIYSVFGRSRKKKQKYKKHQDEPPSQQIKGGVTKK